MVKCWLGGRNHQVENNIFVDCHPAVQLDGRGLDKSPVWHGMVYDYMRQQLARVPLALYEERYPAIREVERYYASGTNGIPPEGNVVARNIVAGGQWLSVGWGAAMSMVDVHDNYVGQDAGFVDAQKMDFELKADAPAWKIGFKEIPFRQIGLRDDEFRKRGKVEALADAL